MSMKVFGVDESFLTVFACERILFRVFGDLVIFEMLFAVEAFRALRAFVEWVIYVLCFVLF